MAKREIKPWHHQVTTALAVVTLLVVVAFFAQTFRSFFLTDHDPVLIAVERVQKKLEERKLEKKAPEETAPEETEPEETEPEETEPEETEPE